MFWEPVNGEASVTGHTIDIKNKIISTEKAIDIRGGYLTRENVEPNYAKSNAVNISNVTFENIANIYGGYVSNTVTAIENLVNVLDALGIDFDEGPSHDDLKKVGEYWERSSCI